MPIAATNDVTAGYTLAEAALYRAEHLRSGAAIEFPLAIDERLAVRLLPCSDEPRIRGGDLHTTVDDDAVILSAPAGWRLSVKLSRSSDGSAPLRLRLPAIALIVVGPALFIAKDEAKLVTIHSGAPIP